VLALADFIVTILSNASKLVKPPEKEMYSDRDSWRTHARLGQRADQLSDAEFNLIDRDAAVSFQQANATPALMSIVAAEGIWIEDASGNRYRDFYGNNCHHVGYQHPRVVTAVRTQLESFCFVSRGLTSAPSIELAEKLVACYPNRHSKVLFAPGGSAAVEIALMIAKVNTGRFKTVSFWDSYHGRSAGALSVGGTPRDRSPRLGPLMPGAYHVPPFYWSARESDASEEDRLVSAQTSLEALGELFDGERDIAALIAEPIRNGPYVPPPHYWAEVRKLCNRYGALLIFDDVPTGLGKTGRLFNCQHFDVLPDITVLGKALGGTVAPLAAVIADASLDTTSDLNLSYFTHEKNALSAAAGLATLTIIVEEKLPEQALRLGAVVEKRLKQLIAELSIMGSFRCAGLMFAIDFNGTSVSKTGQQLASDVMHHLLRSGLLAMPPKGKTLSFSVPLIISESDLEEALGIIEKTLKHLSR
jgi:4-aminobutyrate aminotransferase